MNGMFWMALLAVAILAGSGLLLIRPWLRMRKDRQIAAARQLFHRQREHLEAKFYDLAAHSGKPRGLRWVDCDFSDDVTLVRERPTRQLSAFVAVTISFEAIEGGGMEDVEAVGNLRAATAVFYFDRGAWATRGRVIMNLEPAEAIERFQAQLEPIR